MGKKAKCCPCVPDADWGCEATKKLADARGTLYEAQQVLEDYLGGYLASTEPGGAEGARDALEILLKEVNRAITETAQPRPCHPKGEA